MNHQLEGKVIMNDPKNGPIPAPTAAEETVEVTGVERAARPPLPTRPRTSASPAAATAGKPGDMDDPRIKAMLTKSLAAVQQAKEEIKRLQDEKRRVSSELDSARGILVESRVQNDTISAENRAMRAEIQAKKSEIERIKAALANETSDHGATAALLAKYKREFGEAMAVADLLEAETKELNDMREAGRVGEDGDQTATEG